MLDGVKRWWGANLAGAKGPSEQPQALAPSIRAPLAAPAAAPSIASTSISSTADDTAAQRGNQCPHHELIEESPAEYDAAQSEFEAAGLHRQLGYGAAGTVEQLVSTQFKRMKGQVGGRWGQVFPP